MKKFHSDFGTIQPSIPELVSGFSGGGGPGSDGVSQGGHHEIETEEGIEENPACEKENGTVVPGYHP